MGQVGLEWQVAGFGDFSGNANETDMLMRNTNTGAFEIYDISNNTITSAAAMGQVGLEWQVAGFGPINGAGASDMLMRNINTGAFEIYDIANNQHHQRDREWVRSDWNGRSPALRSIRRAARSLRTRRSFKRWHRIHHLAERSMQASRPSTLAMQAGPSPLFAVPVPHANSA